MERRHRYWRFCSVQQQVNNEMAKEERDRDPAEGTMPTSIWITENQKISIRTVSCVTGDLD